MTIRNFIMAASAVAALTAAPVLAQSASSNSRSAMSDQSQAQSGTSSSNETMHENRADKERMMAGKQAHAAKQSHRRHHRKMAARHHRMAAAHDRAAAAAQDQAAMAATPH